MRHGLTDALLQRLHRNPPAARPILEVLTTDAEDILDTEAEYLAADDIAGFTIFVEGGAKLTGADSTAISQTTVAAGSDITSLLRLEASSVVDVAVVEWGGAGAEEQELNELTARLDPDVSGGGAEVTTWYAQLYRLADVSPIEGGLVDTWRLVPISAAIPATAGGATEDVSFIFTDGDSTPRVGGAPSTPHDTGLIGSPTLPTTVVVIWALKAEGTTAGNCAWLCDTGEATVTVGLDTMSRFTLTKVDRPYGEGGGTWFENTGLFSGLPVFALKGYAYTEGTLTWTSAPLDLGASPGASTRLEIVAEGQDPGSTSLLFEIWDGAAFIECVDGDQIGVDNTSAGGADLSGVGRAQTYDVQVTLTPSTGGDATPKVRRFGVREITAEVVDGLAKFGNLSWAVDPVRLQSEIPELEVVFPRTGNRDYRSYPEELLANYHINQVQLRVWIGHPDLSRKDWLHVDDFYVDDYNAEGPSITLTTVSPLVFANRDLPPLDTGDATREPLDYSTGYTIATASADLFSQMGTSARLIGPGVSDDTVISKTVKNKQRGLEVLRELLFLAGSAYISSQGRLKAVSFIGAKAPVAVFAKEETTIMGLSPGYRERLTSYSVGHGWDDRKDKGRGSFAGESYAAHSDGIEHLGRALVGSSEELSDSTAQWVPDTTLADTVARRVVEQFGTGMALIQFRTNYPHPWLEPGDVVAIEQDRFIGRDPNRSTAIRGPYWARARIQRVHDLEGRTFTAWLQSWADLLPSDTAITRVQYADPEVISAAGYYTGTNYHVTAQCNSDSLSVRVAASDTPFASVAAAETAARAAGASALDSAFAADVDMGTGFAEGSTLDVAIFAYESATGTLAEGLLYRFQTVVPEGVVVPNVILAPSQSGSTATLDVTFDDPQTRLQTVRFKKQEGGGDFDMSDPTDLSWTADTAPYQFTATIASKHTTTIAVSWEYTDLSGGTTFLTAFHEFDSDVIAEINSVRAEWRNTGSNSEKVTILATGDEDVANMYINVGLTEPATPTVASHDATISGRDGFVTVTGGPDIPIGDTAQVKIIGTNADADEGPEVFQKFTHGFLYQAPKIRVQATRSGGTVTVIVNVEDYGNQKSVQEIDYKMREGIEGGDTIDATFQTTWTSTVGTIGSSETLTRTKEISVVDGLEGMFFWRVQYFDENENVQEVGEAISLSNLEEISKEMFIHSLEFEALDDTVSYEHGAGVVGQFLGTNTTGVTKLYGASLVLPIGVTVKGITLTSLRSNASDTMLVAMQDVDPATAGVATLGTATNATTTGAYRDDTAVFDEVIVTANKYHIRATMRDFSTRNVRLWGVKIDYDMPAYQYGV